jgi:carbon monoxide dehydrogenase subunit G
MKLTGSQRLALDLDEAWRRLSDLRLLAEALPDARDVEASGDGAFEATFRVATGLGATPMRMSFEVVERSAPTRLVVRGSGGAAEYALRLQASFELAAAGEGTEISWALDLHLHGVLRSLTQRVIGQLAPQQVAALLDAVQRAAAPAG